MVLNLLSNIQNIITHFTHIYLLIFYLFMALSTFNFRNDK